MKSTATKTYRPIHIVNDNDNDDYNELMNNDTNKQEHTCTLGNEKIACHVFCCWCLPTIKYIALMQLKVEWFCLLIKFVNLPHHGRYKPEHPASTLLQKRGRMATWFVRKHIPRTTPMNFIWRLDWSPGKESVTRRRDESSCGDAATITTTII